MTRTEFVTCPLCEATCGLAVTLEGDTITSVRGDDKDVFSAGYICPKGASLKALHEDPDRLREPMIKRDGQWQAATWAEAFDFIDERLPGVIAEHGRDTVAVYLGNPAAHNLGASLYGRVLYIALGTHNLYTAGTVDQIPKHFSSGYLFGDPLSIPIPDLDRTRHLLLLGANPLVSNGSLMTAPDVRARLRSIRDRGGKVVVIDPRKTRTAEAADEHFAIRPGTDAFLLFAMVNVLFAEELVSLGALAPHVAGLDEVQSLSLPFTPDAVAELTGIDADDIRRMTRELAAAEAGAVYARIGTTTQTFGTLASWLVDVLNVLTGNLDRVGGAMFPLAPAGQANASGQRRPFTHGRWRSRVRGLPEVMAELPVATLAEEILTPGAGQVRALITVCGNPCVSTPNVTRLTEAIESLDFMIAIDIYLNETSRLADVVLPGPVPLAREHFDLVFYQLSVRNIANWTPAVVSSEVPSEWQTLLRLAGVVTGQGADVDTDALDDTVAMEVAKREGVDIALAGDRRGPARLIDIMLRGGPYDLTLADLENSPHGVDLGPLRPRVPDVLATASGKIELAAPAIVADVDRMAAELSQPASTGLVLIGRRQLGSNNSWMHNLAPLVRGSNRCTAHIHPDDAQRLGLVEGGLARVRSRAGAITVPVEITDTIRPGVVSIPHGWGHGTPGARGAVAAVHAGVNSNILADDLLVDALTGTAALNGIPIEVVAAN